MSNTTIVTGLWDINRHNRPFDQYIENFQRFLRIPQNLYIYVPADLEDFVWQHREPHNTFVKVLELEELKEDIEFILNIMMRVLLILLRVNIFIG